MKSGASLVLLRGRRSDAVGAPHHRDEAGTHSEAYEYGDKTSFWIEDGGKFLEFVESRRFTAERTAESTGLKAARHPNELRFLVSNMQLLAGNWRESIDAHGALTFYIDAY